MGDNERITYKNSVKIIDNVTLYCNDNIDESIIKQLRFEMLKVMDFFKLKEINKKVNIRIWDNITDFREECEKLSGYELPFWAVGMARNEKDEEYSYIDKLSLVEQKKIDYHKDATLDDFIKSIVHEFVHVCHTQFCDYNYPEEPWVSEGIATYLANQYPNSEYTVSINEVFGYDEVPYQNYRCLYNYIFENYSYDDIMKLLNSDLKIIDDIRDNVMSNEKKVR